MKSEIFISTDLVDHKQKIDLWREVNRPLFDTMPWPDDAASVLEGMVTTRRSGALMTAESRFNKQQYKRDRSVILRSGLDNYLIQILTAGTVAGEFNGVSATARAGDIFILDLGQVLLNKAEAGGRIMFLLPRESLEKALNGRNLHGTVLKGDWPATVLLSSYLKGLHAVIADLSADEADAAQDAMVALLSAAFKDKALESAVDHSALGVALRERIIAFLDSNIHQPNLSVELIMRRFKVSRSHLYRTFEGAGGVARILRDMRLDAAFMELTGTVRPSTSIGSVAHQFGFSSGNQFLRAFRTRFGVTPSQAKEQRADLFERHKGSGDLQSYYAALREQSIAP